MSKRPTGDDWHLKTQDTGQIVQPTTSTHPAAVSERKRNALHMFASGLKTGQVAKALGISPRTLNEWTRADPEYKAQLDRVKAERDQEIAEDLEDIAIRMAKGNADVAKDGLPVWSAVKEVLRVTAPERWGQTVKHQHSGNVFHTLIPTATRLEHLPAGDVVEVEGVEVMGEVSEADEELSE